MNIAAATMLIGFLVDVWIGWPGGMLRYLSHPVIWLGALISALERRFNHGSPWRRRFFGGVSTALVIACAALPMWAIEAALLHFLPYWLALFLIGLCAWPLLAVRSLYEHVIAVARMLSAHNLEAARSAVSRIVGRDPQRLDGAGVARAGIESLAENTSDGVIAPLFWGVLFGLPGIAAYKAINTLDSMIAHRTPRYEDFGKVAARLDDVVNVIPSRLTAVLFILVSPRPGAALGCAWRDARRHRSPNAGWPEAAMAGGLGIRLSGPRLYDGAETTEPWLNADAPDPTPDTFWQALRLYRRCMLGTALILIAIAYVGG